MGGKLLNLGWRTVQAFIPGLARPADAFARRWLTDEEYSLYLQLDVRDRSHSVLVARRLLDAGTAERELVAAALLHDIGKSLLPFNPVFRVIAHLYRPRGLPSWPLQPGLHGALQLREHHEQLGAQLIRDAGGSPRVAQLVRQLGDERSREPAVRLLREADAAT